MGSSSGEGLPSSAGEVDEEEADERELDVEGGVEAEDERLLLLLVVAEAKVEVTVLSIL